MLAFLNETSSSCVDRLFARSGFNPPNAGGTGFVDLCNRQLGREPTTGALLLLAVSPAMITDIEFATRVSVAATTLALHRVVATLEDCNEDIAGWQLLADWSDARFVCTLLPFACTGPVAWGQPLTWLGQHARPLRLLRHQNTQELHTRKEQLLARIGAMLRLLVELSAPGNTAWTHAMLTEWLAVVFDVLKLGPVSLDLQSAVSHLVSADVTGVAHSLRQKPPSFLQRNWPLALAGAFFSVVVVRHFSTHDVVAQSKTIIAQTWASLGRLAKEYIVLPITTLYSSVRYNERQFALMSVQSVQADVDSLSRMVLSYVRDLGMTDATALANVQALCATGDISAVLVSLESEIKHPIQAALFGNLIRAFLILAHKSKVDTEHAVLALDKLMRANELNFQVISALPLLWGLGAIASFTLARLRAQRVGLHHAAADGARHRLWQLMRAVNQR